MDAALLANLPLMAPPPEQHSDFGAPAPVAKATWVLPILTLSLAFLAVAMRINVRLFINKQRVSWDDAACLVALGAGIVHNYVILKDLEFGLGKHMWNVQAISMTHKKLLTMTSDNFIICFNMLCVRISVLGLYHRLFGIYEMSKKLIFVGYFIAVLVALPELSVAIGRMKLCMTATADLTDKYCFTRSISIAVITFAITGVLVDAYIYSIAIFRLRSLQVKRNKRVQLMVLFGFGSVALVFGLCNMIFTAIYFQTKDQLWFALWVALFKILEANIALTCACATFLPALWKAGRASTSSVGSIFRKRSANLSLDPDYSHKAKSSIPKGRELDEELVLSPSPELKPIIYTNEERPVVQEL